MERADGLARSLRYYYILGFDAWEGDALGTGPLLKCFTALNETDSLAMHQDSHALLTYLVTDTTNNNSLRILLGKARENARGSQDRITKEVWEQINLMYHYINSEQLVKKLKGEETLKVLDQLEKHCLMYSGIVDSTMPRGLGWEFMNIGKFVERCLQTVDLTDACLQPMAYNLHQNDDLLYWRRLLYSLSGYELYLKSNRGAHHSSQVINHVIFDKHFPRSVIFSLMHIEEDLQALLEQSPHADAGALVKRFGRLKSMVAFADANALHPEPLQKLLMQIRQQVWDFSAEFTRLFFSYA